jgi:uncharacterized membrane protein
VTARDDRGSTIPLILGFFLVCLLMVAGAVAAGDAFMQQRDLQAVCDGAAVAAAASAVDLDRTDGVGTGSALRFRDVSGVVGGYLGRDNARSGIRVHAALSPDAQTITLTCSETRRVTFGGLFGKGSGVHHTVTSAARAPIR